MKKVLLFAFALISVCASAQVYPLVDGFETYPVQTELGTQGGYNSDMMILSSHGINQSNGLVATMSSTNTEDSLVTPLIGPLTAQSVLSFQYRIMQTASYPSNAATLGVGDKIEVFGRLAQSGTYMSIASIDANNQTVTDAFKKLSFSLGDGAGEMVDIMIKVNGTATSDYFVDIDSFSVNDQVSGLIIKPSVINPVCHGDNTGGIVLTVEGGVQPYTYGWSNTLTSTPTQSNLAAGTYSVTVWDNSGRSASTTITLTQPEPVTFSTTATNALCSGSDNGTINLTVHSGVSPYTFLWNNQAQTKDLSGLTAGTYQVVVTDATQCSASGTQTILDPLPISATETFTNASAPNANDGSITVVAAGGTTNYQYSIDGSNYSQSNVFSNLSTGCYNVRIKDSNNCQYNTESICLSDLVAGINSLTDHTVTVFPNPATDYITVKTQVVVSGSVSIVSSLGTVVFSKNIRSNNFTIDVTPFATGKYILVLQSDQGTYSKHIAIVR